MDQRRPERVEHLARSIGFLVADLQSFLKHLHHFLFDLFEALSIVGVCSAVILKLLCKIERGC